MKNLVLIGMAGAAKTTTGKAIAKKLNMPFFDTDEVYVSYYRESISDTFANLGEEVFRKRETTIAKMLGKADGAVIACGGGIVLREENMTALKQTRSSSGLPPRPRRFTLAFPGTIAVRFSATAGSKKSER